MLPAIKESDAMEIVRKYFTGWKNNDIQMIIDSLEENIVIIESHGPTYHGIGDIQKWFEYWLEAKSKVLQWEIKSFYFCEKNQSAFCEWDFKCKSFNTTYAFPGASIIKFSEHSKIFSIHEYKMSKPPYKWDGKQLDSE